MPKVIYVQVCPVAGQTLLSYSQPISLPNRFVRRVHPATDQTLNRMGGASVDDSVGAARYSTFAPRGHVNRRVPREDRKSINLLTSNVKIVEGSDDILQSIRSKSLIDNAFGLMSEPIDALRTRSDHQFNVCTSSPEKQSNMNLFTRANIANDSELWFDPSPDLPLPQCNQLADNSRTGQEFTFSYHQTTSGCCDASEDGDYGYASQPSVYCSYTGPRRQTGYEKLGEHLSTDAIDSGIISSQYSTFSQHKEYGPLGEFAIKPFQCDGEPYMQVQPAQARKQTRVSPPAIDRTMGNHIDTERKQFDPKNKHCRRLESSDF